MADGKSKEKTFHPDAVQGHVSFDQSSNYLQLKQNAERITLARLTMAQVESMPLQGTALTDGEKQELNTFLDNLVADRKDNAAATS